MQLHEEEMNQARSVISLKCLNIMFYSELFTCQERTQSSHNESDFFSDEHGKIYYISKIVCNNGSMKIFRDSEYNT